MPKSDIGLIGLAVMGQNLVLNMSDHGVRVAVYNRSTDKVDAFIAGSGKRDNITGCHSLQELVLALETPRRIMLMVRAGDEPERSKTLSLYNWSDYIADGVLSAFEKECGVKIAIDNYDDNESLFAKFQAGGNPGYDLVVPSDYMVEKMIAAGMLLKIDYANVPNVANLDPTRRNLYFDPKSEYSIAYFWGTTGIAYDTAKIQREVTAWRRVRRPRGCRSPP